MLTGGAWRSSASRLADHREHCAATAAKWARCRRSWRGRRRRRGSRRCRDAPVGAPPEGNAKEVTRRRRRVTTVASRDDGGVERRQCRGARQLASPLGRWTSTDGAGARPVGAAKLREPDAVPTRPVPPGSSAGARGSTRPWRSGRSRRRPRAYRVECRVPRSWPRPNGASLASLRLWLAQRPATRSLAAFTIWSHNLVPIGHDVVTCQGTALPLQGPVPVCVALAHPLVSPFHPWYGRALPTCRRRLKRIAIWSLVSQFDIISQSKNCPLFPRPTDVPAKTWSGRV